MNKPLQPQAAGRWLRQISREAGRQLAMLRDLTDGPAALAPFIEALEQVFVANDPRSLLLRDGATRSVIGIYCILVPEELIYAVGAIPLRLCGGCSSSCAAGEEHVPRDGCPLAKSSLGLTAQPGLAVYDLCDVVIVPTTCDAKRKFAEELSRFREVWMLEVPHLKDSEISQQAWLLQVMALKERLEQHMSREQGRRVRITAQTLDQAIQVQAAAQSQMRRLQALRSAETSPLWGRQAMVAANAFSFMEVEARPVPRAFSLPVVRSSFPTSSCPPLSRSWGPSWWPTNPASANGPSTTRWAIRNAICARSLSPWPHARSCPASVRVLPPTRIGWSPCGG